jgi:hypothetical protein
MLHVGVNLYPQCITDGDVGETSTSPASLFEADPRELHQATYCTLHRSHIYTIDSRPYKEVL